MKHYVFWFLVLVSQGILLGQTPEHVVFAGKISHQHPNAADSTIELIVLSLPGSFSFSVPIDEQGRFSQAFSSPTPSEFLICYHDVVLSIPFQPGDSLFFEIEARPETPEDYIENVAVRGKGYENATIALAFRKRMWEERPAQEPFKGKYSLNPTAFLAYADSIRAADYAVAKQLIDTYDPSPIMRIWLTQQSLMGYFTLMNWYPEYTKATPPLPERFDTFYKELLPDTWTSSSWVNTDFWDSYAASFSRKNVIGPIYNLHPNGLPFDQLDSLYFQEWASLYKETPDFLTQACLSRYVVGRLNMMDLNPIEVHGEFIEARLGASPFWPRIQDEIDKVEQALAEESALEAPVIYSVESVAGKDLLDTLIAHHPGQVIYLDIWATWCGPCRAQFPFSTQLHEDLQDEPIAFVYLCMESDSAQYLPLIKQYNLSGSHYFLTQAQGDAFDKVRNLNGFPQYLIIDKEGKIVEYRAESPDSDTIKQTLLSHSSK